MRRLLLASACALACVSIASVSAKDTVPLARVGRVGAQRAEWVTRSNELAQPLLKAQAEFAPEYASLLRPAGLRRPRRRPRPGRGERFRAAMRGAQGPLQAEPQDRGEPERPPGHRTSCSSAADARSKAANSTSACCCRSTDVGQLVFGRAACCRTRPSRAPRESARSPEALRRPRTGQHADHDAGAPALRGKPEQPGAARSRPSARSSRRSPTPRPTPTASASCSRSTRSTAPTRRSTRSSSSSTSTPRGCKHRRAADARARLPPAAGALRLPAQAGRHRHRAARS